MALKCLIYYVNFVCFSGFFERNTVQDCTRTGGNSPNFERKEVSEIGLRFTTDVVRRVEGKAGLVGRVGEKAHFREAGQVIRRPLLAHSGQK